MASTRKGPGLSQCSFCAKLHPLSKLVITGQGRASTCYNCIQVLGQLVAEDTPPRSKPSNKRCPLMPRGIYADLDTYMMSQEKAKKTLSVTVYT